MNIVLTRFGGTNETPLASYFFDDDVRISFELVSGDVFLVRGNATQEHFDAIKERENLESMAWSELVTESHEKESIV